MELDTWPVDALYRDKVLRAREVPPGRKLLAPARLFDYASGITMAAIRNQRPHASESELRALFRERMRIARQLENSL